MEIDINILDKIETDIIDKIKQVPIQRFCNQVSDNYLTIGIVCLIIGYIQFYYD